MHKIQLTKGWQLKQHRINASPADTARSEGEWIPAAVPGTVHQDLLASGRIPDPFYGLNEHNVQWVGEQDWLYRCSFEVEPDLMDQPFIDICLDGLDTFASVYLNGRVILQAENMFVPYRLPVGQLLHPGPNEIWILFESAWRVGKQLEGEHGVMGCWNTDPSRVYVRKAQYHYGWDWGPTLITAGPWRPVYLEAYEARLADVHCPIEVSADLSQATMPIQVELSGDLAAAEVVFHLEDPDGRQLSATRLPAAENVPNTVTVDQPELWWPNGHGAQALHRLRIELRRGEQLLDEKQIRLGLRRLRLVQEPLQGENGKSFYFEVNNTPVFCGGANWIPADNFIPRLTPQRYRAWLELAAQANMNMLRVWGGGIYENDIFYDLCDEFGLLVWQDFMFGCALYPAFPEFLANVRREAEANVRRLRQHACLALWSGNNEDYQIAQSLNVYAPDFDGDFPSSSFPAREIYERLLPEICAELDPTRPYWPGSPYWEKGLENLTGDSHIWQVWHGQVAPYQDYSKFPARFASEFGMQAAPHRTLIDGFASQDEQYPASRTLDHHNKAADGPRRLAVYLNDNVYLPNDLDSYIYATQLVQAESDAAGVRAWRRRWVGPGRYYVAGALVWQLNDCWPVTSWAIADYSLRQKAAYYALRRELAPVVAGLVWGENGVQAWVVNGSRNDLPVALEISAWSLGGRRLSYLIMDLDLLANHCAELPALDQPEDAVVVARLVAGGQVVTQATLWPEPLKYLDLYDPDLSVRRLGNDVLELSVMRPAKGVWLDGGAQVVWSDNNLDLVPGEPRRIRAIGLGWLPLHISWIRRGRVGGMTV